MEGTDDLQNADSAGQQSAGTRNLGLATEASPQADQGVAAVPHDKKLRKEVVQYSHRPVPTAKQKAQAAHSQYLLDMKEYFAEVLPLSLCCQLVTEFLASVPGYLNSIKLILVRPALCTCLCLIKSLTLALAHTVSKATCLFAYSFLFPCHTEFPFIKAPTSLIRPHLLLAGG